MTTNVRLGIAGITLAAVLSVIGLSGSSEAAFQEKDLKVVVQKIADALKKGDKAGAKKLAEAAAKNKDLVEDIPTVMHMFRAREKGGMGFSPKVLVEKERDGIDLTLRDLRNAVPKSFEKELPALETTGYWIAAIAELANAKGWDDVTKTRTKKEWKKFNDEMGTLAIAFTKAKTTKDIKAATITLYNNCAGCHLIFKDQ